MKRLWLVFILAGILAFSGCAKKGPSVLTMQTLQDQVEIMARTGVDSVPSLSVAGRVRVVSENGRGSTDILLLYQKGKGLRLEVVDPLYRPMMSALLKGDELWVHDVQAHRTSTGKAGQLMQKIAGIPFPDDGMLPLLLGKMPQGEWTASKSAKCDDKDGQVACFTLREQSGRVKCHCEISTEDGSLKAVILPSSTTGRPMIRAEFGRRHSSGIPRKTKIFHLDSDDFVLLNYMDIQSGVQLDISKFDPDSL